MKTDLASHWVYQTLKLHDEMKSGFVCDANEQWTVIPDGPFDVFLLVYSRDLMRTG